MLSLAETQPNTQSFCHLTRSSCGKTWMKWNDKRSILLLVASSDSETLANDLIVLCLATKREGTIPLLLFFVFTNFAIRSLDAYFTTFPQEQFQIDYSKFYRWRWQTFSSFALSTNNKLRTRCGAAFSSRVSTLERRDEEERERARGKTDGKKRDFSGGVAACNQGPDEWTEASCRPARQLATPRWLDAHHAAFVHLLPVDTRM